MGILNLTHDSFFAPSRAADTERALIRAGEMVDAGADILDIGAESSRPGSEYVSETEELDRIIPVVTAIRRTYPKVPISVDTRKSSVARAALDAGAEIINDISALRDDREMIPLLAERRAPVVLMHMRGTPQTMQDDPHYEDVVEEVSGELLAFARRAMDGGIEKQNIILDPGIGFGKRMEDNWELLRNLDRLKNLDFPLLVGLSRKSFLGRLLKKDGPRPVEERLNATIAAQLWCTIQGVEIIRVHDVQAMRDALRVWEELFTAGSE